MYYWNILPFLFVYSTGLSLQHISSSLLSNSITDSYTEYNSLEESLSSFSSPELFRGSDYLGEKIISILNCFTIEIVYCPQILQWTMFFLRRYTYLPHQNLFSLFGSGVGHVTCFGNRISVNKTYANLWNMLKWLSLSSYTFAILRRICPNQLLLLPWDPEWDVQSRIAPDRAD